MVVGKKRTRSLQRRRKARQKLVSLKVSHCDHSPCFPPQESYPAVPPIWSVESDDPNLAAVLERLVDIKKGNTLVRGPVGRSMCVPGEASAIKVPCER